MNPTAKVFGIERTSDHIFMDLWAAIGRGKAWQGILYNRIAQGEEKAFVIYILPDHEKLIWAVAQELLSSLRYASIQPLEGEPSQLRSQNETLQDQLYLRQLELGEPYKLIQEYEKA